MPIRAFVFALLLVSTGAILTVAMALGLSGFDGSSDAMPQALVTAGERTLITPADLIEEPDVLPERVAQIAFFSRQSDLALAMQAPGAQVETRDATGTVRLSDVRERTLGDLPFVFWFQVLIGVVSVLIGAWVVGLRPADWGARLFALLGLFLPAFAMPAAIYSTRPLAMDGALFETLSILNHFGACAFGAALVCLFLVYPRQLVPPPVFAAVFALTGILFVLDVLHILPVTIHHATVAMQMLAAIVAAMIQWWLSRRRPVDRAGLRWFLTTTLVGAGLFIALRAMPPVLGMGDSFVISQGYAFGLFLTVHLGLAAGLARYRLFELNAFAYRVWFWFAGILLVVAIDLGLVVWLNTQAWTSLPVAIVVAGLLYFPLRQHVLERIFTPKRAAFTRSSEIVDLVFTREAERRDEKWDTLLASLFDPLESERDTTSPVTAPRASSDGSTLLVPSFAGLDARRLRLADRGRRLFGPDDIRAIDTLLDLGRIVEEGRAAYKLGVVAERDRISRDLHDHLGAQLLSALHTVDAGEKDELLRRTLSELRTIVSEEGAGDQSFADVMADLRPEIADRLSLVGITLDYRVTGDDALLPPAAASALRATLRELVSNVIKHADASVVSVCAQVKDGRVTLDVTDDGRGFEQEALDGPGRGMSNLKTRAAALGGSIVFAPAGALDDIAGVAARLRFPLEQPIAGSLP